MAKKNSERAVLVTTVHRGVFFGYVDEETETQVILTKCRNVLYWGRAVKGFLGLSTGGPDKSCRVGPATVRSRITNITSVTDCTPEAVKAFEAAPWG